MNGRLVAGRYELSTPIGKGGMGQVWQAYDRTLDRRVAVKLLRVETMTTGSQADELRRRFTRECRTTAQVDHPGLVTVHDAGSDAGELYLVMQHVGGADLADHLAEHEPYPWQWAVAVAAQLCAVLCAVHAVPIVHRDLKPRNIMVRPDGTVTVLDLGIAAVLDADTTRLTRTGVPIGTPAYMAPEQAMGGAVGPYTDLYALGVVLHELLTGGVPFAGSTALGVLHRHLYEAPAPVGLVRPEVPGELADLVLSLLAKDPQDRPATAHDVYEALVPLLPAPDGGRPAGMLDPTRPFRRPHAPWPDRAAAPAGGRAAGPAGAQEALGAPGGAATPVPAGPSSATPAGAPPARAGTDLAAAVDEVKQLLDAGRITQAVDILGGILPEASARHGEGSTVVRMIRRHYAASLMDDGQYRRALPELRRLADERAAESGQADPQALRYRYEAAQCLEQIGAAAAALAEYRALLPYFTNPYAGLDPADALGLRHRTAQLQLALGDHTAAGGELSALLPELERVYGPAHPLAESARRALASLTRFGAR
ncbi:serine/threonine-protein kinase [Streptomyces sp. CMB-StM0423]|uniref:serine/threonine-protein kinase n=1 Tax=Streptomyces sp. CMB-StM0423 TaxID=2059884 RepID=UPI000C712692|nr:serine/threonine-protein kinase [Streptomyces sp. CMB-StM0423]AUH40697.1 serine/threonine protein kinase [Streptomyces sp. CMB-StM0423]